MPKTKTYDYGVGIQLVERSGPAISQELEDAVKLEMEGALAKSKQAASSHPWFPTIAGIVAQGLRLSVLRTNVYGIAYGARSLSGGLHGAYATSIWAFGTNRQGSRKGRGRHMQNLPGKPGGGRSAWFGYEEVAEVADLYGGRDGWGGKAWDAGMDKSGL